MSEKRIKVVMTPAGKAWDAEKEYRLLDYISDGLRMWLSVKVDPETGVNKGHALTDAAWWSACVDMSEALTVAEEARTKATEAADKANTAATAANNAADTANGAAAKADAATSAANNAASAANTASSAANTAASNANAKATEASKVNAIITEENVLEVTDRTGAKKTLSLVTPAKAEETAAKVEELDAAVKTFVDKDAYVGFYRMNGDASPDAEVTYGSRERMKEIGAEWKLATVKNGKITHIMAPGRLTLDVDGNEVKINGEDGDVMLINRNCYLLKDTKEVEGRELNIIGIGNRPGVWMGTPTKHIPAFGMTPCETVNGKIFDDVREQAHCVFNTDLNSTTGNSSELFVESYKKSSGGYPTAGLSSTDNIKYAQAKNEDALTARPYMGWYYETYEALLATMFAELGSLCHTKLTQFGSGFVRVLSFNDKVYNDEQISGISGWKVIAKDGTVVTFATSASVKKGEKNTTLPLGVSGENFCVIAEVLEGQRILDGIAKAGLTGMMGDKNHIFCYGEDGGVVCVEDGSVNIDTGEGMDMLKKYYIVRDVPGCEGMADGVMTAVVNRYVRMEMTDGVTTTDGSTDLSGATVLLKISIPIYRGFTMPLTGSRHMNYFFHLLAGVKGDYKTYCCFIPRIEDVLPLTDFSSKAVVVKSEAELPLITIGTKIIPWENRYGGWWLRVGKYGISLFYDESTVSGGTYTYECFYTWSYTQNFLENSFKTIATSLVVGCPLNDVYPSFRNAAYSYIANSMNKCYFGAFAVLLDQ